MRPIQDQQYSKFNSKERLNLTIAALSRNDETEANRLWQTCPRFKYDAYDLDYTLSIDSALMIGALFFQKCVLHYNTIKRAESFILYREEDLKFEVKEGFENFAEKTRKHIELAKQGKHIHTSQLKALFAGFEQFCIDVCLDNIQLLKTIPLKDCCHDLEMLLTSDIEIDSEYSHQIKDYFLELWHH